MSGMLSDDEIAELIPSEHLKLQYAHPDADRVQRRILSRSAERKATEVESRLLAMADELGGKQGLDRRRFSRPRPEWRRRSWR